MSEDDPIVSAILHEEGWPKYTDSHADRGGPTKGGITLATLSRWRKRSSTIEALKALTEAEAREIYREEYVVGPGFDAIRDGLLRHQVVDAGVTSGPVRPSRWLQDLVGVAQDGKLGPKSLAAINAADPHELALRFAVRRIAFFAALVERDHGQAKWLNGWIARTSRFILREAMERGLTAGPPPSTSQGK